MKNTTRLSSKHDWLKQVMGPMYGSQAMFARFNDAVAANDANNAQPVTEPDASQVPVTPEGEQAAPPAEEPVPFNEDPKIQEYIERQVAQKTEPLQMQLNQYQQAALQAQQPQPTDQDAQIEQFLKGMGIDPEYATPAQMTKAFIAIQNEAMRTMQNQVQQSQVQSQIPDLATVVGATNPLTGQFMPGAALSKYLAKNPMQTQIVQQNLSTPQGQAFIYQAITNDSEYRKDQLNTTTVPKVAAQAQQMIDGANSMASISNVGGTSSMDKTSQINGMSDADFQKHKQDVIARA